MRNWAFLFAAAALVVAGCGGGGGGSSKSGNTGTATTGTQTGSTAPAVNLGSQYGQIELTFLTGQGRSSTRAAGDMVATLGDVNFTDVNGNPVTPTATTPLRFQLNGYQDLIYRIDVPFANQVDPISGRQAASRLFPNYTLNIGELDYDNGNQVLTMTSIAGLPQTFPAHIRVMPGRYTSQPVFLNDADFTFNDDQTAVSFNQDQFNQDNELNSFPQLDSFFSDYLAFDISNLASGDRPALQATGAPAGRLYVSGDGYAISENAASGIFESISQSLGTVIEGHFAPPGQLTGITLPNGVTSATTPGTYSLVQPDPSDPDPFTSARIVSLQGIWRDYNKMITNAPGVFAISFPGSADNSTQDFILVNQTTSSAGYKINAIYFGTADFSSETVRVYPIKDLINASTTGEVDGTINQFKDSSGMATTAPDQVRTGTFTFSGSGGVPAGFGGGSSLSGTFVVYRK